MENLGYESRVYDPLLEEHRVIFVRRDLQARLESEVWEELDRSVQEGWRTQEEAEDLFSQWREDHRSFNAK